MFESLAERVKIKLLHPSLPELTCAASLAHNRLLCPVYVMKLENVDLSTVPSHHMVSLSSCVIRAITIKNVSACNLVTILDSLKCKVLTVSYQSLGMEETQALVAAMKSRVERVDLKAAVTLDMGTLTGYSGHGACKRLSLYDGARRYREEFRAWASRISLNGSNFKIRRTLCLGA